MSESLHRFNLGRDCKVVLIGPYGRVDLSDITEFNAKQKTDNVNVKPLNAPPMEAELPGGWDISFKLSRSSPDLDNLIAAMETEFWSGGNIRASSVYQYITELNGSTSTFQFDGFTFKLDDAGTWKQNSSVDQSISGFARTRKRI